MFSKEANHRYAEADVDAVAATLRGGSLSVVFGRQTMRFEREFARHLGTPLAVALSSGTAALDIALDILDVGYGDEVVIPAYAFNAPLAAVLRNLAVPVFADISAETFNVTAETVAAALTDRTRAVLVVHMFGNPVDVPAIRRLCDERGIAVIEDCAQALGATVAGRPAGSFGTAGCFSFNEIKNLTTGEGGMLTLAEPNQADLARVLRLHGTRNLLGTEIGLKSTMTEMEAALGRSQLGRLVRENAARAAFGERLGKQLAAIDGLLVQQTDPGSTHVYSRFVLRVDPAAAGLTREELTERLAARQMAVRPVYPVPLYRQPMFTQLATGTAERGFARSYLQAYGGPGQLARWADETLPETELFCAQQIGFVVPPGATEADADRIAAAFAEAVAGDPR